MEINGPPACESLRLRSLMNAHTGTRAVPKPSSIEPVIAYLLSGWVDGQNTAVSNHLSARLTTARSTGSGFPLFASAYAGFIKYLERVDAYRLSNTIWMEFMPTLIYPYHIMIHIYGYSSKSTGRKRRSALHSVCIICLVRTIPYTSSYGFRYPTGRSACAV